MVFVTRRDLGVNTVDELIALAKKSSDKPLTYGSVGIGSPYHLILENVQAITGAKLVHVPYKVGPAIPLQPVWMLAFRGKRGAPNPSRSVV